MLFRSYKLGGPAPLSAPDVWDIIADFTSGDKIDLRPLNAKLTGAGPDVLTWLGIQTTDAAAGTNAPARAHGVWTDDGNNFIYADIDGDGAADMKIQVNGNYVFGPGDFIDINEAPHVTNDTGAVVEAGVGGAGDPEDSGNVLANDTDPDADPLSVTQVNGSGANVGSDVAGTYGALHLNGDGSWTYTLNNADSDTDSLNVGETATETVTYVVADSHGATATATLTVTIMGANDGPTASQDFGGPVTEDGTLTVTGTLADRKSTRLNSSHTDISRMPSSA